MAIIQRDSRWENILKTSISAPPESSEAGGFIKLYVGLGNVGKNYAGTRHNAGFIAIDELRTGLKLPDWQEKPKFSGLVSEGFIDGKKIILLKPSTMMNLSGQSVLAVANFYKIDPSDITIFHDELDLPFGEVKLKNGGKGDTSHNGLKDVASRLNSTNFVRIRIGINQDQREIIDSADFVLARFSPQEEKQLPEIINKALSLI